MRFFVGLDDLPMAQHFDCAFISVNRLWNRKSHFKVNDWIMDSGAFTELLAHGNFRKTPEEYAAEINRWASCGNLLAACTQDYMCEPIIRQMTGAHLAKLVAPTISAEEGDWSVTMTEFASLSVAEHQRLTIERYDRIQAATGVYVMPVLQGYAPQEYVDHIRQYGDRLKPGMWVGVGSICKRQNDPKVIAYILRLIKAERPDLRLHGFGVKITALRRKDIQQLLFSADSMAWSFAARKQGRNAHHVDEPKAFVRKIHAARDYQEPGDLWLN